MRCRSGIVGGLYAVAGLLLVGCTQSPVAPPPRVEQLPSPPPAPRVVPQPTPRPAPTQAPPPPVVAQHEQTHRLGTTVENRPVDMVVLGHTGPVTLVMGGFHGNEPTSVDLAKALLRYLRANPDTTRQDRVAVITAVNPDGLARGTRHNARNVDVNRNFPARNFPSRPSARFAGGTTPGSERETRMVMAAVDMLSPAKIISIHSIARGRHGNNYDGPARSLAMAMSGHNDYPVLPTIGYPTPGSFGAWAGDDHKFPTVTLELPRDASGAQVWAQNREALLAAIRCSVPPRAPAGPRTVLGK